MAAPEDFGDFRHAHQGAGVTGIGLLDGVHGEGADGASDRGENRGLTVVALMRLYPFGVISRPEKTKLSGKPGALGGAIVTERWENRAAGRESTRRAPFRQEMPSGEFLLLHQLQIKGVRINCIAMSSLSPGTTRVFARDMKESLIIARR